MRQRKGVKYESVLWEVMKIYDVAVATRCVCPSVRSITHDTKDLQIEMTLTS